MTNSQHTPGPWTFDPQTYEIQATRQWRGQSYTLIVADVGQEASAAMSDDECRANARLIAQAPAMLDAIRAELALLERTYGVDEENEDARQWAERMVAEHPFGRAARAILRALEA